MTNHVSTQSNLFDYFSDRLELAMTDTSVQLSSDASLYLTSLLVDRARADRPRPTEDTLAEMLAKASTAEPTVQAATYRELGDRSLYVAGYFRESLSRGTVGPSYYEDMGVTAYRRTDQVLKRWFANAFGEVFDELATRFQQCVALLGSIRSAQEAEPTDVMRLYAEWVETGSEEAAQALRERGLIVARGPTEA